MGYGRGLRTAYLWSLIPREILQRPAMSGVVFLSCHALQWSLYDVFMEATQ
jgi:hypothetical protein